MLRPYCGEYLVSPVPVHLGLNRCSHGCVYCFANNNVVGRRTDMRSVKTVLDCLARNRPGKNVSAHLLSLGHPVLISNDADPFAASNREQFAQIQEVFASRDIPITIQTKGGDGCEEFLRDYRPTMVYVSVTSDQDAVLRQTEPGAPLYEARRNLLLHAKACGHHVVVGINPYYAPWWLDIYGFVDWLAEHGLDHVWLGELHISRFQRGNIPPARREKHAEMLRYGMSRIREDEQTIDAVKRHMDNVGINCFAGALSRSGGFWDAYFGLGYPFFPTIDAFFTHLRQFGDAIAFGFDYFHRWTEGGCDQAPPFTSSTFTTYLNSFGRSIRNTGREAKAYSFRDVHNWLWQAIEYPTVFRREEICVGVEYEADGEMVVATDNDKDILVFVDGGSESIAYDINRCQRVLL